MEILAFCRRNILRVFCFTLGFTFVNAAKATTEIHQSPAKAEAQWEAESQQKGIWLLLFSCSIHPKEFPVMQKWSKAHNRNLETLKRSVVKSFKMSRIVLKKILWPWWKNTLPKGFLATDLLSQATTQEVFLESEIKSARTLYWNARKTFLWSSLRTVV